VRRRALDVEIAAADSKIGSYGSYGTDCCEAMIPQGRKTTKALSSQFNGQGRPGTMRGRCTSDTPRM